MVAVHADNCFNFIATSDLPVASDTAAECTA
eukprot:COSAG06_NODE_35423_length_460_cov_0.891967_1_plen_31_part_01